MAAPQSRHCTRRFEGSHLVPLVLQNPGAGGARWPPGPAAGRLLCGSSDRTTTPRIQAGGPPDTKKSPSSEPGGQAQKPTVFSSSSSARATSVSAPLPRQIHE